MSIPTVFRVFSPKGPVIPQVIYVIVTRLTMQINIREFYQLDHEDKGCSS